MKDLLSKYLSDVDLKYQHFYIISIIYDIRDKEKVLHQLIPKLMQYIHEPSCEVLPYPIIASSTPEDAFFRAYQFKWTSKMTWCVEEYDQFIIFRYNHKYFDGKSFYLLSKDIQWKSFRPLYNRHKNVQFFSISKQRLKQIASEKKVSMNTILATAVVYSLQNSRSIRSLRFMVNSRTNKDDIRIGNFFLQVECPFTMNINKMNGKLLDVDKAVKRDTKRLAFIYQHFPLSFCYQIDQWMDRGSVHFSCCTWESTYAVGGIKSKQVQICTSKDFQDTDRINVTILVPEELNPELFAYDIADKIQTFIHS